MTREEASYELERLLRHWDDLENDKRCFWGYDQEAVEIALSALRPIIREQVEKARWIKIYEDGEPAIEQHQIGVACSKCMNMPKDRFTESKFCPNCGRPMTDKAVEITMKRMEEMRND